jgi:hypothetical protein
MRKFLLPLLWLLVSCQATTSGPDVAAGAPDLMPLLQRVTQARDAFQAAAIQFQQAGAQLAESIPAGAAQSVSTTTVTEHNDCVQAAVAVSSAIAAVDETANALFQQWQIETAVYTDSQLKAENQSRLTASWQRYAGLLEVLRQSAAQMDPVLAALNTNAQSLQGAATATTVSARSGELAALQNDINALVQQLNNAIARADTFIASTQQ